MKHSLIAFPAAVLLIASISANADTLAGKPFIGANFGSGHTSLQDDQYNTGAHLTANNTTIDAYLGYALFKYFGLQLNAGGNIGEASSAGGSAKLEGYGSVYVRGTLPFQGGVSLYGLAGYTYALVKGTVAGNGNTGEFNSRKGSPSYGIGLQLYGNANTALTFAYTRLLSTKVQGVKISYDTASIGVIHYFDWPHLR